LTIRDKYGEEIIDNPEAMKDFWKLLDERMELCHRALLIRCRWLEGTKSDIAPILWQDGAIARLKPGETIDKYLKDGYSTTSLGYVGLFETMMSLTGKPHTDPSNIEFSTKLIEYMKNRCDEWNAIPDENYGFSLYGTPEESLTYKFAKALQSRHGVIDKITDKNYIINSYHFDVTEEVDAFTKLSVESEFQKYTTGGAISYVETPNMINNIEGVVAIIKHIYENIMYAELNCKLDYCQKCGYNGEITMIQDENKKYKWTCPSCGNNDLSSMNVVRRVCGYMSNANYMNQGRMQEIGKRKLHV
jgi:ribonucleoside-triphosphate reductase